ncbi:MAG: restriction endonuclease subunit S [Treponema sp.]|jgi:type I restriction enzyme S subunit|nr:restriction endonuclease subunit S [Treponema sp.]
MKAEIRKRIEAIKRGEVPSGYSIHFGMSPETWKRYRLSEICEKVTKKNIGNSVKTVLTNSAADGVILQSKYFEKNIVNEENTETYFIVENKDFIYNPRISSNATYGPISSNELGIRGIVSPLYTVFRQTDTKNVTYEYLKYFFASSQWHEYIYSIGNYGVRFDRINILDDDFFNMPIIIPPVADQKRIVEFVSHCEKVIKLKEDLLAEKRKLKKWLLENLLNPNSGVRLPGFRGKWEETNLLSCSKNNGRYGVNASACSYKKGLPKYIRITDIDDNGHFSSENEAYVDSPDAKNYFLQTGDLLFVRTGGTVGKTYLYNKNDGKLVYAGYLIKYSLNDQICTPSFIKEIFNTSVYWKWVTTMSSRSGQPGINAEEYSSFSFFLPSLKEQEAIANILSQVDSEINLLDKELTEWCIMKKALMQVLLTGIVRVEKQR